MPKQNDVFFCLLFFCCFLFFIFFSVLRLLFCTGSQGSEWYPCTGSRAGCSPLFCRGNDHRDAICTSTVMTKHCIPLARLRSIWSWTFLRTLRCPQACWDQTSSFRYGIYRRTESQNEPKFSKKNPLKVRMRNTQNALHTP